MARRRKSVTSCSFYHPNSLEIQYMIPFEKSELDRKGSFKFDATKHARFPLISSPKMTTKGSWLVRRLLYPRAFCPNQQRIVPFSFRVE